MLLTLMGQQRNENKQDGFGKKPVNLKESHFLISRLNTKSIVFKTVNFWKKDRAVGHGAEMDLHIQPSN